MVAADNTGDSRLDRRDAVAKIMARLGDDALFVTGLGSPSYDVHAAGDRDNVYYLWGAMGAAALVGLGIAQAQPDRHVVVITGDGEQLMAFGALATIAVARPKNLDLVILDNQHFGETGMQSSHTGQGIDLAAIAATCGFDHTETVTTDAALDAAIARLAEKAAGPRFLTIKISDVPVPRSLPVRDATFIKNRFRGHLGLTPS